MRAQLEFDAVERTQCRLHVRTMRERDAAQCSIARIAIANHRGSRTRNRHGPPFQKRQRPASLRAFRENGGQGGNRTPDTGIFNPLLYQLSYLAGCSPARVRKGRILAAREGPGQPVHPHQHGMNAYSGALTPAVGPALWLEPHPRSGPMNFRTLAFAL